MEKISSSIVTNTNYYKDDDNDDEDDVALPGFRFHPTDEELVGFYLRRKVENRPIGLEIIKQIDIYKYDPWDLPKGSNNNNGDKEWYFYCKRGRKYKNSTRPNRVVTAGSGFWKATGIDRPIYSSSSGKCIGLKKSLVYYKGSAGKGTKTEWQMHEFRLPSLNDRNKSTKHLHANVILQEDETWTLCRILKRNVSYRKSIPDWKEVARKQRNDPLMNMNALSSKLCTNTIDSSSNNSQIYISFSSNPVVKQDTYTNIIAENKHHFVGQQRDESILSNAAAASSSSTPLDFNEWLDYGNWDELRSIFELSFDPFF